MKWITEKESERILWVLDTLDFINQKMAELKKPFPVIYEFEGEKYYKNLPTTYSWKAQERFEFHPKYQPIGEYDSYYHMMEEKKAEFPHGASIVWGYRHSVEDRYSYCRLFNDRIELVSLSRYGEQVDEVRTWLKFDDPLLKCVKEGLDWDQSPYEIKGLTVTVESILSTEAKGIFYDAVPHLKKIKKDIAKVVDDEIAKHDPFR